MPHVHQCDCSWNKAVNFLEHLSSLNNVPHHTQTHCPPSNKHNSVYTHDLTIFCPIKSTASQYCNGSWMDANLLRQFDCWINYNNFHWVHIVHSFSTSICEEKVLNECRVSTQHQDALNCSILLLSCVNQQLFFLGHCSVFLLSYKICMVVSWRKTSVSKCDITFQIFLCPDARRLSQVLWSVRAAGRHRGGLLLHL